MPTTYNLDCGSGYGGEPYSVGQVLRNSDHRIAQGEPEYLLVEKAGQRYYREDAMSFGVGDESGYAYWATARPATDEESRPLREAREQKLRALALQARKSELAEQIKSPPPHQGVRAESCSFHLRAGVMEPLREADLIE